MEAVARAYVEAGSQVILTNTFRANAWPWSATDGGPRRNQSRGRGNLQAGGGGQALVFASIGPSGKMLMTGEISEERLIAAFAAQAAGAGGGGRGRSAGGDHE